MKTEKKIESKIAIVIGFIVVAIWAGLGTVVFFSFGSMEERGQFGDLFGVVNALFSGLALAGIIYTILLQREELELTRRELTRTAEAQEKSEQALTKQVSVQKDAALLAALDTLIRQNTRIIEVDASDEVARRLPHYSAAIRKVDRYTKILENKIEEMEK